MGVAVSVAGAIFHSEARQNRAVAEADLRRAAQIGAEFVDQQIAVAGGVLSALSVSPALHDGDFEAFYHQASAVRVPRGSWFILVRPNYSSRADQILNTRRPFGTPAQSEPPTDTAKALVASVVASRQIQVSDLVYNPLEKDYVAGVGVPIIRNGDVAYVLVLALPEIRGEPALEGQSQRFGGVIDRSGQLLPGHSLADRTTRQAPFDPSLLKNAGADGNLEVAAADGTPLFIAFARSQMTGWTAFVGMPRPALDAPVDRAFLAIGIGAVLLPLGGIALALLAGPGVILPLQRRIEQDDARVRAIADAVPSMIFTANQDGACDYASERFYEYTGLPKGSAAGFGWMQPIHPEDRAEVSRKLALRPELRKTNHIEFRMRGRDGCYRWFAVRVTRVTGATGKGMTLFGTATDIDDLKRTEGTLRQLSTQLMRTQDDERRRIAREIHDATVPTIAAAKWQVERVRDRAIPPGLASATALGDAHALLNQSLSELRTLSYVLHPPLIDQIGLAFAVRWYAQGFEKRSGIEVSVEVPALPRLQSDIEMTLFRIIQEGLANIHRHSGSREARIAFEYHPRQIELEIADKGKGMSNSILGDAIESLGVGIPGMRLRVQQLGGTLEIDSSSNGTTLHVVLPLGRTKTHSAAAV